MCVCCMYVCVCCVCVCMCVCVVCMCVRVCVCITPLPPPQQNYIKAIMRLFVGEPVWTPVSRPVEQHPSRQLACLQAFPATPAA